VATSSDEVPEKDRQARILDAVVRLLGTGGISAVSMRAVAREAGVSLGLVNYYYEDKTSLIRAALHCIEQQDMALVEPDRALDSKARLRAALGRVADPEFLTTEYLSLRLQLWSLARAQEEFEQINTEAQKRYRAGLAKLVRAARPDLSKGECDKRAADIDVVQNGLWLTASPVTVRPTPPTRELLPPGVAGGFHHSRPDPWHGDPACPDRPRVPGSGRAPRHPTTRPSRLPEHPGRRRLVVVGTGVGHRAGVDGRAGCHVPRLHRPGAVETLFEGVLGAQLTDPDGHLRFDWPSGSVLVHHTHRPGIVGMALHDGPAQGFRIGGAALAATIRR
jgi:AcrR family transcriptional regulator